MLTQLSSHVWILPQETGPTVTQPTIGIVVDGDQTVLIDAGNGAPHAARIKTAVASLNAPPISHIIYTHHHWDHVFGAYLFDAAVIANQRSVPHLRLKAQMPWSDAFLQARGHNNPAYFEQTEHQRGAAGDWLSFRIVEPTVVFDHTYRLKLAQVWLTLRHVGGQHALDSIIITVEDDGIMFVGDSYYPPPTFEQQPGQPERIDVEVIERLLDNAVHTYVPGHNEPHTLRQMQLLMRWQKMKDAVAHKLE